MEKYLNKYSEQFYLLFRLVVGVLFFMHGLMKLNGFMAGKLPLASLMGAAMVIELLAGILLVLGLFTKWTALVSAIEMLVAFFMVHAPNGWNPLSNQGEPAALFFAAFLALMAHGAGKFSLDHKKKA
jgi:putative oxidoreductase